MKKGKGKLTYGQLKRQNENLWRTVLKLRNDYHSLMEENGHLKNLLKAAEASAEKYKSFFDDVAEKPNCNTCADQKCTYRPNPGEITRFNCPLWRGQKEE